MPPSHRQGYYPAGQTVTDKYYTVRQSCCSSSSLSKHPDGRVEDVHRGRLSASSHSRPGHQYEQRRVSVLSTTHKKKPSLFFLERRVLISTLSMVNPDGRCYVFDERGSGYARGDGIATIILKRLDHALADGDTVHAVIVNSGLNQDGKTAGISLPSGEAQAALMKTVYGEVGLDPADTPYVEAHGTVSIYTHLSRNAARKLT